MSKLPSPGELEREGVGSELERTRIHELLSNKRRVRVLERLRENEEWSLSELAEAVAIVETGDKPPPRDKRQSVYVTLDQSHLPKLDDYGVVDYDTQRKTVTLRPRGAEILAENCDGETESDRVDTSAAWLDRCLAVAAGGVGLTALSRVGVVSIPAVSPGAIAETSLVVVLLLLVYRRALNERP